jgi:hypothetical protein
MHTVMLRRSLVFIASAALISTTWVGAGHAVATPPGATNAVSGSVPIPTVRPIPGSTIASGALQDLPAWGYTEREYVVSVVEPRIYRYPGRTTKVVSRPAPTSPAGAYRSRIIVRAPADPAAFNGRVLVEMLNTTASVDLDVAWHQSHEYLMRDGWAYVGVTVQQTGLTALQRFTRDPQRYEQYRLNLRTPAAMKDPTNGLRDPSIAWDLTSQVGALLSAGGSSSPLSDLDVSSVYLTGQSQMAGYLTTYIRAIHPLHNVFDGFLVAYRGGGATNLRYVRPRDGMVPSTSTSLSQRKLHGRGTPVIALQSESDPLRGPLAQDEAVFTAALWRADNDTPRDKFRLWEIAGASHNDRWGSEQAVGILARDYGLPFTPSCDWTAPTGVNDFPARFAWNASLESLARWHESDIAPASADRILRDERAIVQRDSNLNAVGGLRLPRMSVPVATFGPISSGGLFCPLTGSQSPFSDAELNRLYESTEVYVQRVSDASNKAVNDGFLLPEDAQFLIESARRGPAADAATIRTFP